MTRIKMTKKTIECNTQIDLKIRKANKKSSLAFNALLNQKSFYRAERISQPLEVEPAGLALMQTIREAGSMPPNLVRHLLKAATHIPRSGCKSGMGVTASACLRMARIWLPLNRWR